jgi:spermidine/putrescine transport system permease protein
VAPYALISPGGLWLLLLFVIPFISVGLMSLQTFNQADNPYSGTSLTWHFATYGDAISQYWPIFVKSLWYALAATLITLVVAYPVSYWIAFRGGRHKNTYLFLLVLPFFVSYVIRTIVWQFILSDDGMILGFLKNTLHVLPSSFHVINTATAVIAGLAYNTLPFTALPLYVSLEKIDRQVVEAAGDLYADAKSRFLKVILPLTIPGIFAAFLLTFVPNMGDYVEASVLGGPNNTMIGNIIQTQFLANSNYPMASALSVILMGFLLIGILVYAWVLGANSIEEYV